MTSIVPETGAPYMNLLRAVGDSDGALGPATLGPCVGDDVLVPPSPTAVTIAKADNVLGPCVGDDGDLCDLRLKRDVCPTGTLPNGLQLYSFRYWNDDRTFVSVMAQDLLEDERFGHAVIEDASGYYKVDLAALGLEVAGSRQQFRDAGRKALADAKPVTN